MYRRHHPIPVKIISISLLLFALFLILSHSILFSSSRQAYETAEKFYTYEQQGNFSGSWELFHPYMKEKFPKAAFIQDRSHVFIGHFGAETFTFKISKSKEFNNWKPAEGQPTIKKGYQMTVTQKYTGKYGKFSFQQEVFAVKHKGQWVLIWDYR